MSPSEMEQLRKILASPQGKKLMKLLSRDGGSAMREAGDAVSRGQTERVRDIMGPMVSDPEVQQLLKSLEKSMNHG